MRFRNLLSGRYASFMDSRTDGSSTFRASALSKVKTGVASIAMGDSG
eukprot:CAMPEP_0201929298 /NCGR_PEP_ID=MMETSP0903-20130614/22703_1 /ASSEMBLY_ACC=CAM_ASM_000552 /TAXON_ID=420261 /ORGANISM="Thalassiosira antarctica, Strain CCMP982" /LENGTH=46 /DNA_ID= /DNA_START= /DNA_END= /DNA_ORIENTATION=